MVEQQPSKLNTRVRFPSPAPILSSIARIPVFHSDSCDGQAAAGFKAAALALAGIWMSRLNGRADAADNPVLPAVARQRNQD
jgi:hypothetical protein